MNIKKLTLFLFLILTVIIIPVNSSYAGDKKPKKIKQQKIKQKKIKVSLLSISQQIRDLKADEEFYAIKTTIALRWYPIVSSVRDATLSRQAAIDSFNVFTNDLWEYLETKVKAKRLVKFSIEEWVFPVKGYTSGAIGGRNGSGYVPGGFDFFDLNSGGHPAHDIFIDDRDQDCLDDETGLPVEIVSMSGGIVVETRKDWTTERMDIKGGNIVYVYDNFTNGLFYYAHLKDVYVSAGDLVTPGMALGTMGRTGKNAYPSRSPTHLHIMYVRSFDGDLRPENIYNDLLNAKTIY